MPWGLRVQGQSNTGWYEAARNLKLLLVTVIGLALAGCLESRENLFNKSMSVTPLPVGRYAAEDFKEGKWLANAEPGFLSLRNGSYVVSTPKEELMVFDLFPVDGRYWTLYLKRDDGHGLYLLVEARDGMFYVYEPQCADYLKAQGISAAPDEPAAKYCDFTDKDKLLIALAKTAPFTQPMARFKLVVAGEKPPPPAPKIVADEPEVATSPTNSPPGIRLFTLSVCNKSNTDAWYVLFHRHLYEREKWSLRGWWKVAANACSPQSIPKGYFYIFAKANDGAWAGTDRNLCVIEQRVDRVVFENERCLPGEKNYGFSQRFTKEDTFTYNLNP